MEKKAKENKNKNDNVIEIGKKMYKKKENMRTIFVI